MVVRAAAIMARPRRESAGATASSTETPPRRASSTRLTAWTVNVDDSQAAGYDYSPTRAPVRHDVLRFLNRVSSPSVRDMNPLRLLTIVTVLAATSVSHGDDDPVSFRNQIVPILTKAGCNAGC